MIFRQKVGGISTDLFSIRSISPLRDSDSVSPRFNVLAKILKYSSSEFGILANIDYLSQYDDG